MSKGIERKDQFVRKQMWIHEEIISIKRMEMDQKHLLSRFVFRDQLKGLNNSKPGDS
jgi:hypothetical protein